MAVTVIILADCQVKPQYQIHDKAVQTHTLHRIVGGFTCYTVLLSSDYWVAGLLASPKSSRRSQGPSLVKSRVLGCSVASNTP